MTHRNPDCIECNSRVQCATHGQNAAHFARKEIARLRLILATVTACPKRKRWDRPRKVRP